MALDRSWLRRSFLHAFLSDFRWYRRLAGGRWERWWVDPCRAFAWLPAERGERLSVPSLGMPIDDVEVWPRSGLMEQAPLDETPYRALAEMHTIGLDPAWVDRVEDLAAEREAFVDVLHLWHQIPANEREDALATLQDMMDDRLPPEERKAVQRARRQAKRRHDARTVALETPTR